MGVLNVTPDSFSDGGLYATVDAAVARGLDLMAAGADVVDVGGESSRPGAEPVPVDVELDAGGPGRRGPRRRGADRRRARGAGVGRHGQAGGGRAALAAGASLLNDISASLFEVAAAAGAGWVAMHMRGRPRTMQDDPQYADVVDEVSAFLLERAGRALPGRRGRGLGRPRHRVREDGGPQPVAAAPPRGLVEAAAGAGCAGVLVGTSRKRFLGVLAAGPGAEAPAPVADRAEGSLATEAAALVAGVGMVRVHDVAATVQMTRLYGPAA